MSLIAEEDRVPELGDRITIISKAYGSITGRILYRDEALIRVKPQVSMAASRRTYDFPLNPETGEFQESLGVEQIQFHVKRSSPWFSKQLAILPESDLLLYTTDPTPQRVHVLDVISTEEEDAIVIQREGREEAERIDFDFVGPPPPLVYLEPIITETEQVIPDLEPEPEPLPVLEAPGAVIEIANIDKTYSNQEQLEAMLTTLLSEVPVERHTSDRVQYILKRHASTLLSMKQAAQTKTYAATTLLEAIQSYPTEDPFEAVLPVTNLRRSLYLEDIPQETDLYKVYNELETIGRMLTIEASGFDTSSESRGNRFSKYLSSLLSIGSGLSDGTIATPYIPKRVVVEQDVFRAPTDPQTRGLVSDLPSGYNKTKSSSKESTKLKQRYIGNISHHTYRLTGETVIKHPETGQIIQIVKADTLDPLEYRLLPPSIAQQRCTMTRTGVLLWDVRRSEHVRFRSQIAELINTSANVQVVDDSITLSNIVEEFSTVPFYNLMDPILRVLLDGIGLRHLEFTPEVFETVSELLTKHQRQWNQSYDEVKKHAAISKPIIPVISSAIDAASPLLTSLASNPLLQPVVQQIQQRESSLKENDLVLADGLLHTTNRTIFPLWWGTASGRSEELKQVLEDQSQVIQSETRRLAIVDALSAEKEQSFHAEPILNTCEHVKELDMIRGIEFEKDRMKLFELFYNKYESGTQNNWIQCKVCHQDLVCRHELLLLQEYKSTVNTKILHKTIIIEFGDRAYNGYYICKNCGIPFAEIEYDTNPEFDDDGHILQGRSILTDEPTPSMDTLDTATLIQEEEMKDSKLAEDKLKIYNITKIFFEHAGANPSEAIYKRCVNTIYHQLLIMEDPYKERIFARIKTRVPAESSIVATLVTILSAAYVIAELQISEDALPIYITKYGCDFSRDGIPRDKEGTGLLDYIICILLDIESGTYPWSEVLWIAYNGEGRRKVILQEVKYALTEISKLPMIQDALHEARAKKEASVVVESVPVFRKRFDAPPAITNRETFQQSVQTSPLPLIRAEVIGRTEALSQEIIQMAHQHAFDTKEDLRGANKRLDGQCEKIKLQDLGFNGFGIIAIQSEGTQQEIQLLREATPRLLQRDPTHSLGMSYFITPWSVHPPTIKIPQDVTSLSFRLFMKACSTGPNAGLPHEYGSDSICRRCGLQFPIEILNLSVEEEFVLEKEAMEKPGKKLDELREQLQQLTSKKDAVSQQALEIADIQTDYDLFLDLQDKIHLRKKIDPLVPSSPPSWIDQLTSVVKDIPVLAANWTLFTTFFKGINPTMLEKDRVALFIPLSNLIPLYLRQITNQYMTLIGRANQKEGQKTMNAFAIHLETICVNDLQSVRTLLTMFIRPLKQIANGIEHSVKGSKWFKGIKPDHEQLLQDIWKRHYTVVSNALETIENYEQESYKTTIFNALNRYTNKTSAMLDVLFDNVRISSSVRQTEYKDMVRWIILSSMSLLLDESSLFYNMESTTPFIRQTVAAFLGTTMFQLMESIHKELQLLNKSPEQIRFEIEARKQMERQKFIEKQDGLKGDAEKRGDNLMKLFGLGDYSQGALTKKFNYDAEYYEFHREQRLQYGLPEFSDDTIPAGGVPPTAEEDGTFDEFIGQNEQDD